MGSKVSHHAEVPQHQDKSRNADGNSRPDCDVTHEKAVVTSQTAQERVASWVISCQREENKNGKTSAGNKKGEKMFLI